jgi:alpha-glucosidase
VKPLSSIPPTTAMNIGQVDTVRLREDRLAAIVSLGTRTATIRIFSNDIVHINLHNGPDIFEMLVQPILPVELLTPRRLELDTANHSWIVQSDRISVHIAPDFSVEVRDAGQPRFCLEDWKTRYDAMFCRLICDNDEHLYGLGEKTGGLDKRGRMYTQWTTDVYPHMPTTDPLYQALPVAILASHQGARGIFFANTFRTYFDSRQTGYLSLGADHGPLSLYLCMGPTVPAVLQQFTSITGRTMLPPRWALGFHQSRYSYCPESRVLEVAEEFRRRQIPLDAIHLDIDYMDDYRVFTWSPTAFPNPSQLFKTLADLGVQVVTIVDPGVKEETAYPVYDSGQQLDAFMSYSNGEPFRSYVWPGQCVFPDFVRSRVRQWWGQWNKGYIDLGVGGIWNDMNEPALFGADLRNPMRGGFASDAGIIHVTDEGLQLSHEGIHNIYALLEARATYDGIRSSDTSPHNQRPFVLSRSGYAGIQNFSAVWTGDNSSWWEHLAMAIPMCLNLGLSGVPFVGPDIGGFTDSPSPELFARWIQAGVFFPLARIHSNKGADNQEPWAFGPEVEDIARRYITYRYRLLPYLETLFEESMRTGAPIMRPLFWEFANDPNTYHIQDQFMLGSAILVAPVVQPGVVERLVYVPEGDWYNPWSHSLVHGGSMVRVSSPLDQLPLFLRAGSVIPLGPAVQSTQELAHRWAAGQDGPDIFWIVKGRGHTSIYSDDGFSLKYRAGECRRFMVDLDIQGRETTCLVRGDWPSHVPTLTKQHTVRVVPFHAAPERVEVDGQSIPWSWEPQTGILTFQLPSVIQSGRHTRICIIEK